MSGDLDEVQLSGSAITPAFLRGGLFALLDRSGLLDDSGWDRLQPALRRVGSPLRQIGQALGYARARRQDTVITREGVEEGGWLLEGPGGVRLRAWMATGRMDQVRTGPMRTAQRVLLSAKEPAGLVVDNDTIHLLLCDPTRTDSIVSFPVDSWRDCPFMPASYRVLRGLAGVQGLPKLSDIMQAGRLHQTGITTALRLQARRAITSFINAALDRVENPAAMDPAALWREGLVLVYRLLFILKLEAPSGATAGFGFASTRLWRDALSPNTALGPLVRRHLDQSVDTGRMLETGLRTLFNIFRDGLSCSELAIAPFGGALFGSTATPLLDGMDWGEPAVAHLLDNLIWTRDSRGARERVHYGTLDVEDLGGIYEALLEQEPAIARENLTRIRRGRAEAFVPLEGGEPDIRIGEFFLRSGMGRKASGSFYTPHEFVHFLVAEALGPKIAQISPAEDPQPASLLRLRIVDPAMGSGHFLVEACRVLGEALLNACRRCDEMGLHDRVAALPDPDNTIAAYLPSRGYSEARARAICRRLVAVHCLYGCDRNGLAIELAKLSLWLESYAEGLPLTFLNHRLVQGDALTGPFFASLRTLPVTGGPLDPLLARGVTERLEAALGLARQVVARVNGSIGRDVEDVDGKQEEKRRLDAILLPLRQLARAWSGAAMLRERNSDDAWLALAHHVAATGLWPTNPNAQQAALLQAGAEAVSWDLVFPDVFPEGFDVVLGNPPWDVLLPNTKDFVASYDPRVLNASMRPAIEKSVLSRPEVAAALVLYRTGFERTKHVASRLYDHQRSGGGADATSGSADLFRLFAERNIQLLARNGVVAVLLPSAFHANEGSTGLRHLYLRETELAYCLSFENRRRIFDIDSRFKFDLIVARRPGPTQSLRCGFYLDRIEDVADPDKIMTYPVSFLKAAGGSNLTPLELRGQRDYKLAKRFFNAPDRLGELCRRSGVRLGCDLHMTADASCFRPVGKADLMLHEGKTFHQYTDVWETAPRYAVDWASLRPQIAQAARHYRLAFRDIARSNDERTMIACIAPPGVVFGHTATVEKAPWLRPDDDALMLCALFNSFPFDWLVRQKAATHLSLYILNGLPLPNLNEATQRFLSHAALHLSCNHAGFSTLWHQQTGQPLGGIDAAARASMRASVDAVVADAYGLGRADYAHLLKSFSHRSNPLAPADCLSAFDTLRAEGDRYLARRDPFAKVALPPTALAADQFESVGP